MKTLVILAVLSASMLSVTPANIDGVIRAGVGGDVRAVGQAGNELRPRPTKSSSSAGTRPVCPRNHLYVDTFRAHDAPCRPNQAGDTCCKTCEITAVSHWKGKHEKCEYEGVFAHGPGTKAPDCWHWAFPHCLGSRQSPINIQTANVVADRTLPPLKVVSTTGFLHHRVYNTGHDMKAVLDPESAKATKVTGGPLGGDTYQVAQFHFHHSATGAGSEHHIDNAGYNAELHIVMVNTKYSGFTVAKEYCDGLAVIGVMLSDSHFKTSRSAHNPTPEQTRSVWSNYIRNRLAPIKQCGEKGQPASIRLNEMLPASYSTGYYTYQGSLTTPPCSEAVTWIVMKDGFNVEPGTFAHLKDIMTTHPGQGMSGNNRPLQPLANRVVYSPSTP